jgi:hypothetical protein
VVQKEAAIQELEENFAALLQQNVRALIHYVAHCNRPLPNNHSSNVDSTSNLLQGQAAIAAQEQIRLYQSASAAAESKIQSLTQQNLQLQQQMRNAQVRTRQQRPHKRVIVADAECPGRIAGTIDPAHAARGHPLAT